MRERPIIFSGEMVRAILEGRKTQTRRVIKPQGTWCTGKYQRKTDNKRMPIASFCPYGLPGDRLWVRETWQHFFKGENTSACGYLADAGTDRWPQGKNYNYAKKAWKDWKPPIFMPRWASRILLKITNVRVEKLQDISDLDGRREGIPNSPYAISGIASFKLLWESINGKKYPWKSNPQVWVISFKRLND